MNTKSDYPTIAALAFLVVAIIGTGFKLLTSDTVPKINATPDNRAAVIICGKNPEKTSELKMCKEVKR